MARKIHKAIVDETHTYAVIETSASSGGRQWGNFVNLSTIKVAHENIGELSANKLRGNARIEILEDYEADARSQGPRSNYRGTLDTLTEELDDHIQGTQLFSTDELSATPDELGFEQTVKAIQSNVAGMRQTSAEQAIERAEEKGWTEVQSGVYLNTLESLQTDQQLWGEEDQYKDADFSHAPYWLTTDNGVGPTPIHGARDSDLQDVVGIDLDAIKEHLEVRRNREVLTGVAREARPVEELASAEEALARRQASLGRGL